ncbi:hypothetical protein [Micromonospora purpureochromogenes]|uniref:Uncharacterized protein n=1 Tax=Micromonospora purpureochromogenes TaxID=47872 RepID=A0ABX2RPE1_9ACTN|nr:hypothetical protein [Micromonospora purpureochromogenes]NYF57149.1 hypothetical protein [Micromonospora purpureochromogenes]
MELPRPWTSISSDIVNSSAGGYPRQSDLALAAEEIIAEAEKSCPYPGSWIRRERGDGELTLAPGDVPLAWLIAEFLHRLRVGVLAWNRNKNDASQLRLRVGLDFGTVSVDGEGVPRGGDAIVSSVRLRDSDAAREAMTAVPGAPIVAVVSDSVYQQVVPFGELGLQPEMFRRIRAVVPEKGYEAVSWLYLPGHFPPYVTGADNGPAGDSGPSVASPPTADPNRRGPRTSGAGGRRDEAPQTRIGAQFNAENAQLHMRDMNFGGDPA